jgi:hypothetical protein
MMKQRWQKIRWMKTTREFIKKSTTELFGQREISALY